MDRAEWDHSAAPYTAEMRPHWMADLEIDPFDSGHVIFPTGYGVWETDHVTAADTGGATRWVFADAGLEETVPLAIISPPAGAHLLTGLGDIDGFRHDDLEMPPPQGMYQHPHFANTESLDFAALAPNVIVRSGTIRDFRPGEVRAAYSLDGGTTWEPLATEPPDAGRMEPRFGGAGHVAVAADGRTVVWTPRGARPHRTADWGRTWKVCGGTTEDLRVVADRVNPKIFYGYDTRAGVVLVSTDGAATFHAAAAGLPVAEAGWFPVPGDLNARPGAAGDLWLVGGGALFHSADSGVTFAPVGGVSDAAAVGFGRAAPGESGPAIFLLGRVAGVWGIFRSDDAGGTWIRISDEDHQFASAIHLAGDPRIFGRVYVAVSGRGVIYGDPAAGGKEASARAAAVNGGENTGR